MIKKDKHLLKEYTDKTGEDPLFIKRLMDHYWSAVYTMVTTTPYDRIKVLNLGTFVRKDWNIDKYIQKYETYLRSKAGTAIEEPVKKDLDLLYEIKKRDVEVKEWIKKEKQRKDEHFKNLEKQEKDTGGMI